MGPENRPGIRAQSQDKQAVESKRLQAVRGIEVKKVLRLQGTQLLAFAAIGDAIRGTQVEPLSSLLRETMGRRLLHSNYCCIIM